MRQKVIANCNECAAKCSASPRPLRKVYDARMPTLRSILKYTPVVVLGLLVVAWVVSGFGGFGYLSQSRKLEFGSSYSVIGFTNADAPAIAGQAGWRFHYGWVGLQGFVGDLEATTFERYGARMVHFHVPIAALVTVVLPWALGPFLTFRFRLWHYLAYTALVAVELAYYLRWQE